MYRKSFFLSCFLLTSTFFLIALLTSSVFGDEDPNDYVKFTTDFDAKCVNRGGVMIYISNSHPNNTLKVTLERWFMNYRTGDRSRSVLTPSSIPEALGCSKVSNGKQEWRVKKIEWGKK